MPELPEVETIRRSLEPHLVGKTIFQVEVLLSKMVQHMSPSEFVTGIQGKTFNALKRRGKYLLMEFTDSDQVLAFHLRMTGQLVVSAQDDPDGKALYLIIRFTDRMELRFMDTRKFGRVYLFHRESPPESLRKLGPEPLEEDFTLKRWMESLQGRTVGIKKVLLDQTVLAGLGNIYTDEALFVAGIDPTRPAGTMSEAELFRLYEAIRQVLSEGISLRGTTKRDYFDGEGKPGSYQEHLRVYGRKGQPCFHCQTPVRRIEFGGRGTYFCPVCQKVELSKIQ